MNHVAKLLRTRLNLVLQPVSTLLNRTGNTAVTLQIVSHITDMLAKVFIVDVFAENRIKYFIELGHTLSLQQCLRVIQQPVCKLI
jgi:hypothetical protein